MACPRSNKIVGSKCGASCSSCMSKVCWGVDEYGNRPYNEEDMVVLAKKFGVAKSVPASGGTRRTYYSNIALGRGIQNRINAIGKCVNNMAELKAEEYKQSPEGIAEAARIEKERLDKIAAETARLELIKRNDQVALNLWNKLESQRIAKEQAEKARLAKVAEDQRLAEIEAERLRIELSEKAEAEKIAKEKAVKEAAEQMEKQRVEKAIPLISSLLPITAVGILLLYSSGGKS